MNTALTTNDVRKKLEDLGAICPSKKAVEVVATQVSRHGPTNYWEMRLPDHVIKQAVIACGQLRGEESNRVFAQNCLIRASA